MPTLECVVSGCAGGAPLLWWERQTQRGVGWLVVGLFEGGILVNIAVGVFGRRHFLFDFTAAVAVCLWGHWPWWRE